MRYTGNGKGGLNQCVKCHGDLGGNPPFLAPSPLHTLMATMFFFFRNATELGVLQFNPILTLSTRDSIRSCQLRAQSHKTAPTHFRCQSEDQIATRASD